jgi:hypothetical protein
MFAVKPRLDGPTHQPTESCLINRPAIDDVPLERKVRIVGPGRRVRPRIEPLHQPRHGAQPPLEMRTDIARAALPRDHHHPAGVGASRGGLEGEEARVLGREGLASHGDNLGVRQIIGSPEADQSPLTFR